MSWVLVKVGEPGSNSSTLSEWQIDSESDIQSPPAEAMQSAAGSIAYTADRSVTYGMSNSGVWTKRSGGSSSGGSGGGSPASGTTVEIVFDPMSEDLPYINMTAENLLQACMAGPVVATLSYQSGENVMTTSSIISNANYLNGIGYKFYIHSYALSLILGNSDLVFATMYEDEYPEYSDEGDEEPISDPSGPSPGAN